MKSKCRFCRVVCRARICLFHGTILVLRSCCLYCFNLVIYKLLSHSWALTSQEHTHLNCIHKFNKEKNKQILKQVSNFLFHNASSCTLSRVGHATCWLYIWVGKKFTVIWQFSPQKSDTPGYLMAAPALLLGTTDDLCPRGLEICILQKLRHQTWATTRVW